MQLGKITRIIVKRFWGLLAVGLFCLAVLIAVGRMFAPSLQNYRQEIAGYLSEQFELEVEIGDLRAQWEGLSPEIWIEQVELKNQAGETLFSVARVNAQVDFFSSLLALEPKWRMLRLDDVNLTLQQNEQGDWQLLNSQTSADASGFSLEDILLLSNHIELHRASFDIYFRSGHSTRVTFPNLEVETSGSFRRYSTEAEVDQQDDVLQFVMETEGDLGDQQNFTAKGYLKLKSFELDRALAALPGDFWDGLPEHEWRKGHELNSEIWFDVFTGNQILARGNIDIGELPVKLDSRIIAPKNTNGRFVFQWRDLGAWSLSLRDIVFDWDGIKSPQLSLLLSAPDLGSKVNMRIPSIDIGEWNRVLHEAKFFPDSVDENLKKFNPRGKIFNLNADVDARRPSELFVSMALSRVSVDATDNIPGLHNITGYLQSTLEKGFVDLESKDGFSLDVAKIYEQPLKFNVAQGQVNWLINKKESLLQIHSGLLSVSSDMGEGRGYFALNTPLKNNTGINSELMLQLGLRGGRALDYDKLVPKVVPEPVREWLERSVQGGQIPVGGFLYRGGVSRETAHQSSVQLFLEIDKAQLSYDPNWPLLSSANGILWMDNEIVNTHISSGQLLDSRIANTVLNISRDEEKNTLIELSGNLQGSAMDGLKLLRETPVREIVGDRLDSWVAVGPVRAEFDLLIPLLRKADGDLQESESNFNSVENQAASNSVGVGKTLQTTISIDRDNDGGVKARQNIVAYLNTIDLDIENFDIKVADVKGKLQYQSDKGLFFNGVRGQFFDRDVELNMAEQENGARPMQLQIAGRAPMAAIMDWSKRPALGFLQGETDYKALLTMPGGERKALQLSIESNLEGISIDLPGTFVKTSETTRDFSLLAFFSEGEAQYEIDIEGIQGVFNIDDGELHEGAINFGGAAALTGEKQLLVAGAIEDFDWQEWSNVWNRYQTYATNLSRPTLSRQSSVEQQVPVVLDLHFDRLSHNERHFDDVNVIGRQGDNLWLFEVDAPIAKGSITWFDDSNVTAVIDLERLNLPASVEDEDYSGRSSEPELMAYDAVGAKDSLADFDPAVLPSLDFATQELWIGEEDYGSWSFQMRPIAFGVELSNIQGNVRGGNILGIPKQMETPAVNTGEEPDPENSLSNIDSGAILRWTKHGELIQTRFKGRFTTEKAAQVFEQWGQPQVFNSEFTSLNADLNWQGSPLAISITSLNGEIGIGVADGEFYRMEDNPADGFLRLLGLLNFDMWARRLRFDFSDLYGKGLAFDSIEGAITFDDGMALITSPIVVVSPSSRMQLAGSVDLESYEIDGTLVARLPVGENLTWVAAFAAGLPAALGVYFVSKIFKKQVDKVASLNYKVQGTVNDPQMEFVRLFDSDAAQRQGEETLQNNQDSKRNKQTSNAEN